MRVLGMAAEIVSEVDRSVRARPGARASRVVVVVNPEVLEEGSLRVAFEEAKRETAAAEAELVVERAERVVCCLDCGTPLRIHDRAARSCPSCGSGMWRVSVAPALTLASVEMQE